MRFRVTLLQTSSLPSPSFFLFISSLVSFFLFSFFLPHLFTSSFTSSFFLSLSGSFVIFCHLHFFPPSLPLRLTVASATPLSLSLQQPLFSFSPPYHVSHPFFSSPQLLLPCEPRSSSPLARPIVACKKKKKKEKSKSAVYCSSSGENLFSTARKASQALRINA